MATSRTLKRSALLMMSAWQAIVGVKLQEPDDGLAAIKVIPGGSTA